MLNPFVYVSHLQPFHSFFNMSFMKTSSVSTTGKKELYPLEWGETATVEQCFENIVTKKNVRMVSGVKGRDKENIFFKMGDISTYLMFMGQFL